MDLPKSVRFLVVGAGVHGLSTAMHLARELKARGSGSGADILVVDKTGIAAGASGIACGVVRNNYYQPAMAELMAANVEVWESDPAAYCYNGVGYIALGPTAQEADLTEVAERQERIGYPSDLIVGEDEVRRYMKGLFPDWRARGVTVALHEHKGGFAFNVDSMHGIADKARAEGVRFADGVAVTGFTMDGSGAVSSVQTSAGDVDVEQVIVGVGPWIPEVWKLLGLPPRLDVRTPDGRIHADREMWTFWYLQEGEIAVDPLSFATADGGAPPVLHVDSDAPLHDDDGKLITDELWGIYFKRDRHGVQGGAAPLQVGHEFELDPYPTSSVDPAFPDMWCASLSHCMERFAGTRRLYKTARSGGVGAFTVDNFPVFDYMRPNVYVIADSNHGYKMIGVGREVAKVVLGDHSSLLYPFRFERFATGDLHPVSNSPYPWS
jgi:glycine/D-amino acid oxidase-like deaminating enzyme